VPADFPADNKPTMLRALIRLLRPKQWSKNLLVFAAYLFTAGFTREADTVRALLAFGAMCAISSATYVVNDLMDIERDRAHPTKRSRPLASGQIPVGLALFIACLLLALGIGAATSLGATALGVVAAYLGLQIAYNLGLKRVPVADVFCIALGFVLRAGLGAAAIHVTISSWLLYCTAALALMLGFAKRRNEFVIQGDRRAETRESLAAYSRSALDSLVTMSAGSAAVCYGIYSIESTTAHKYPALILTSLFVVYGISRYVLLVFGMDEGAEPADLLFRDRHLVFSVLGFLLAAIVAVSGFRLPLLER
jgi:4-hydroxybenzoate polyprenyltransferase